MLRDPVQTTSKMSGVDRERVPVADFNYNTVTDTPQEERTHTSQQRRVVKEDSIATRLRASPKHRPPVSEPRSDRFPLERFSPEVIYRRTAWRHRSVFAHAVRGQHHCAESHCLQSNREVTRTPISCTKVLGRKTTPQHNNRFIACMFGNWRGHARAFADIPESKYVPFNFDRGKTLFSGERLRETDTSIAVQPHAWMLQIAARGEHPRQRCAEPTVLPEGRLSPPNARNSLG
jgi:hypothetical protein